MSNIILKYDEIYSEIEKLTQFIIKDIQEHTSHDMNELRSLLEEMDGKTKEGLEELLIYQEERNRLLLDTFGQTLAFIMFSTKEMELKEQSISNQIKEV